MIDLKWIVVKFVAFTTVAILLGALLLNTMWNPLSGDSNTYHAVFTDVSGLRTGDDVRVAGVRVGRVTDIGVDDSGARIGFQLSKSQPILRTTHLVMRYQNLLGQRYLAMVQDGAHGVALKAGATVPLSRTSPGFDLTELLNGFRPLFEALRPDDVNALATSLVKVLQGEGGTVSSLLARTGTITNFLADRDQVVKEVLTNLTPVLRNMAGQGTELRSTVEELRALMTGLAQDRRSIGASIDQMSRLIGTTSSLLTEVKEPAIRAVHRFGEVMDLFMTNKDAFVAAVNSFGETLAAFGRAGSYENALNIYFCSVVLDMRGTRLNLSGTDNGPWSAVCR